MPWYSAFGVGRRPLPAPEALEKKIFNALTAAAAPVKGPQSQFLQHTQEWQAELWRYYDEMGELNSGVWWLANMLSRVRLRAGQVAPGLDEPTILDKGTPADVMSSLSGGVGGQAQLMRNITVQMSIPGDCYLIGEGRAGAETWSVRSVDEIRAQGKRYEVVTDRTPTIEWTPLPDGSLPVRIWRPHARYYHLADSSGRSALPILRELELVNRHITAQYLSRLASAGLVIFPDEITFPVREEFEDATDPFMAEWIEIAAQAIATPGTAAAVIPLPIRVPGEFIDKIKHVDFTLKIDEKIIEKRESAITRLANKLDVPAEIMTGLSKVNHWTAWALDEGALKTHIAPMAEIICDSLTRGYLWPRLIASGVPEDEVQQYVVWYDMSELAVRPDRSENAQAVYDRMELSGEALRREGGFDEADAPSPDELERIGLKAMLRNTPGAAPAALDALVGKKIIQPVESPAPSGAAPAPDTPVPNAPGQSPGDTPGPPAGGETPQGPAKATAEQVAEQVRTMHVLRFDVNAPGELLHPPVCRDHAYSCPYTHAARIALPTRLSSGTYECRLDTFGRLSVGQAAPYVDTYGWLHTPGLSTTWKEKADVRV